jgi:hypothetical protein
MEANKITFLIGAGASIPALKLTTSNITDAICTDNGGYVPHVISFIREELDNFYRSRYYDNPDKNPGINYEEIYHIFNQIQMSDLNQYPNSLLVESFLEKYIMRIFEIAHQEIPQNSVVFRRIEEINGRFSSLAEEIYGPWGGAPRHIISSDILFQYLTQHIEKILCDKLRTPVELNATGPFWLKVYEDIENHGNNGYCDIFSLNHDTILEQLFINNNIAFNDGFISTDGDIRIWNRSSFESNPCKMNLFKLHGSISWVYHKKYEGYITHLRCLTEPIDSVIPDGCDGKPALIIGTYDKMLEYSSYLFLDLLHLFYQRLIIDNPSILIIVGYGFRDIGINRLIRRWIDQDKNNKMIVIDSHLGELRDKRASNSIRQRWGELLEAGKLVEVESGIESITWECIKEKIICLPKS